ncbi:MAG TPA: penicillin acylase family protein, partial [Actinomycetota bacterium]|nr:penicillin acylase family protein [Actinomycetota bacterium]
KGDDNYKKALSLVGDWIAGGAHRMNKDNDDTMDQGAALAIFDRWYENLVHAVFDDEIGADGYALASAPITDYDPAGGSSFWFDFSSYLKNIFGKATSEDMALDYCDNRDTDKRETCAQLTVAALEKAIADLVKDQGSNPDEWTTPREDIVFEEYGYGSVDDIPWQNRGTHNHAVEILRDAGPIVRPSPSPTGSSTGSPSPSGSP